MRLYADRPVLRTRQLTADLLLLGWAVLWVLVARTVHAAVLVLAEPGVQLESLGRSIGDTMGDAAGVAGGVPLVGDDLSSPFRSLGASGDGVAGAGQAVQDAVHTLAWVLAVALVVIPVGWHWCAGCRGGWAGPARPRRSAGCTWWTRTWRCWPPAPWPPPRCRRWPGCPAGTGAAWHSGDGPARTAAVRALADLELRRLGLRAPVRRRCRPRAAA